MSALNSISRLSRRVSRRAASLYRSSVAALRAVRHPNAILASLVLSPVLVVGLSFGEPTRHARAEMARAVADMAAQSGFGIQAIRIEGLRDTREGDVLDYLAVSPQTALIGFDIDGARERVLALPWVKDASVRRIYPGTLVVDIEEHAPFARMLNQGRVHLVTLEGEEITDEIADVHAGLPLVVGEGAAREATAFFAQLAARPFVLEDTVALERVGNRRWTLHMREDVQVHLPETGVDGALMQLEIMIRRHALLERAVASVDLRRPDQLVVQLTPQAIEAMDQAGQTVAARGGA